MKDKIMTDNTYQFPSKQMEKEAAFLKDGEFYDSTRDKTLYPTEANERAMAIIKFRRSNWS